eukprot:3359949-Prymnesium_polylepis.1
MTTCMVEPRTAATLLLRLGTLPFLAAALTFGLALAGQLDDRLDVRDLELLRQIFVTFAGVILAFIGGMQQAVGLHAARAEATVLVVGGIGIALGAFAAILAAQFRGSRHAAVGLAVAYLAQGYLEQTELRPPPCSRPLMLPSARRPSMLLAVFALTLASVADRGDDLRIPGLGFSAAALLLGWLALSPHSKKPRHT